MGLLRGPGHTVLRQGRAGQCGAGPAAREGPQKLSRGSLLAQGRSSSPDCRPPSPAAADWGFPHCLQKCLHRPMGLVSPSSSPGRPTSASHS